MCTGHPVQPIDISKESYDVFGGLKIVGEAFRHLDPSVLHTYRSNVAYGLVAEHVCLLVSVTGGYVTETPKIQEFKWIRGQHLETLNKYFKALIPRRIIADVY